MALKSWLTGYITAYNRFQASGNRNITADTDLEGAESRIDAFCRQHPLEIFALAADALVLELDSDSADGHDVPPHIAEMCHERYPVTAQVLHEMWKQDDVSAEWPATDFHIGSSVMALLKALRTDEHMVGMSKDEFIQLSLRICESVYQTYFEQRSRMEQGE